MEDDSGVVHFTNQLMVTATLTDILMEMGRVRMVMEFLEMAMVGMGMVMAVGMALMGPRTK